jgi:hypothetical protein
MVQRQRGLRLVGRREVVAAQEVQRDVLEQQQPERNLRRGAARRIGADGAADGQQLLVERDVGGQVDLDHVVHAAHAEQLNDVCGRALVQPDHLIGPCRLRRHGTRGRPHAGHHTRTGLPGQHHGCCAHRPGRALHQHRAALQRPGAMHGAVRGDAGNAQAGPLRERHRIGQRHRLRGRHHHVLRGCAERPVALRAVAPHALAQPRGRHPRAHLVDGARAVAVRDHARARHAVAERILALLDVARVDARAGHAQAHFAGAGLRVGHFADHQHVACGALSFVPGCDHGNLLVGQYCTGHTGAWRPTVNTVVPSPLSNKRCTARLLIAGFKETPWTRSNATRPLSKPSTN